jgi:hypothetical protein
VRRAAYPFAGQFRFAATVTKLMADARWRVISGPKQAAHSIYEALADQTDEAFTEIRRRAVA